MLFKPTIPGVYIEPSIARESLSFLSNFLIASLSNVGFKTYFMSSNDESTKDNYF